MTTRSARICLVATVICVAAGVLISVFTAANNSGGYFQTSVERAFNTFSFFTVLSNLIVGVSALLLLLLNPHRSSLAFAAFRLAGVVSITVTGVVFHVALGRLLDLQGWDALGNQLVHTVVPVLGIVGWLAWGPRGLASRRAMYLSLTFPILWLIFTLARGAVVHWYPYYFVDVTKLGYGGTLLNCLWVSLLFLGLAAGATKLDDRLGRVGADR